MKNTVNFVYNWAIEQVGVPLKYRVFFAGDPRVNFE